MIEFKKVVKRFGDVKAIDDVRALRTPLASRIRVDFPAPLVPIRPNTCPSSMAALRGLTPVIASHNLRELEDICESVGLLHRGGILFERDLDEMKLNLPSPRRPPGCCARSAMPRSASGSSPRRTGPASRFYVSGLPS